MVALLGLLVVIFLAGALFFGAQASGQDRRRQRAGPRLAEAGARLRRTEGEGFTGKTRKLADRINATLAIEYCNADGETSSRALTVESLFGHTLDWPMYVIGHDSKSGERRTFRLDRIRSVEGTEGPVTDDIPWHFGKLARDLAGVPHCAQPFAYRCPGDLLVEQRYRGRSRTFLVKNPIYRQGYDERGVVKMVTGRLDCGDTAEIHISTPDDRRWHVAALAVAETGEVIEDLAAWCTSPGSVATEPDGVDASEL